MRLFLIVLLLGAGAWGSEQTEPGDIHVIESQLAVEVNGDACAVQQQESTDGESEEDIKRYRLAMLVSLIGIGGLFLMFFLITLLRISRFQRRRLGLGAKKEQTKYVDAWSQYRLKEDLLEDEQGGDDGR